MAGGGVTLPPGPFDCILSDPPWHFATRTPTSTRSAWAHYPTMGLDDICALPVGDIAAKDAVLLMWATMPNLPDAFRVLDAWGFSFRTVVFTWVKLNEDGSPFMGLGYYSRQNAELCILARRGKGLSVKAHDVPSVIMSRRREHSRKPDGQYDHIELLFGTDIRRLEMFSRQSWPGWERWGFDAPEHERLALPMEAAA